MIGYIFPLTLLAMLLIAVVLKAILFFMTRKKKEDDFDEVEAFTGNEKEYPSCKNLFDSCFMLYEGNDSEKKRAGFNSLDSEDCNCPHKYRYEQELVIDHMKHNALKVPGVVDQTINDVINEFEDLANFSDIGKS